jgi:tetratricopeptide (TPR) repeat protein
MLWVYLFLINLMLWPLVIGMDDTPLYLWVNNTVALLLLYLMLPLHELAHAGVCWVLGGKVHEIRVGIGRPVWTTTWRETKVAVHQYPAGGFCRTSFPTRAQILLRTFLTCAAGVAFSGAVIALLLPAYQGSQWLQGLAWREALVWVNGFILIFNLWPREGNVGTIRGATDGAKMLKILRGQFPAEVCHIHHYVVESMYAIRARDFARAAERSRKGISQYPDSPHLKNVRAIALLELGRGADAAALFKEQLDALEAQGPGKMLGVTEENYILLQAMLRNNLVAALLFGPDDPEAASSLLDYAKSAYLLMPWHHAVESTWGGALVEEERVELGLAYLQAAYPAHETDHERAGTLASIAWAQHLLGEEAESEAAMQQALTLDAEHPVVKKVQAKGPFTNNFPI